MHDKKLDQDNTVSELTFEELELVAGGRCYTQFVWIEPKVICEKNPWVGTTRSF